LGLGALAFLSLLLLGFSEWGCCWCCYYCWNLYNFAIRSSPVGGL